MIASKYFEIDEKAYVEADDYDKILSELKNAKNEILSWKQMVIGLENELREKRNSKEEVSLPLEPIDVASMLIDAKVTYETTPLQRAVGTPEKVLVDKYSDDDLRQIAGHLLVYCNHNSEEKENG